MLAFSFSGESINEVPFSKWCADIEASSGAEVLDWWYPDFPNKYCRIFI